MMRHPAAEQLPKHIEPWTIARSRKILKGSFPLMQTQELRQWAEKGKNIEVYLEGYLDQQHRAHLKGQLQLTLSLQCQRCLEPMPWNADIRFDYLLIHNESQEQQVEYGSETLICAEDDMDLAWFLEEEVLLAMPMIAKHDNCTMLINTVSETTPSDEGIKKETPFAQLKTLMNKKEQP
ncbi:YceD family protein [Suttonella ornithocola]|uniref:Large ribosomal RNA subunit accumulation protein YceD n=1 Tax=Suttonella ornithocola TaxID=279832 RepID=A0A380N088_9GAMM|nr:DUF177 domain-containing protein [Suttonella ornithocola]SUO97938.1 Uncharacterized ACR, COG1399 [Suttonella ornithocola]